MIPKTSPRGTAKGLLALLVMTCLSSFALAQTSEDDPNGTEVGAGAMVDKGRWEVVLAKLSDGSPDITGSSVVKHPKMLNNFSSFIEELSTTLYSQRFQTTEPSTPGTLSSPVTLKNDWKWHWRVQFVRDWAYGEWVDFSKPVYVRLESFVRTETGPGNANLDVTAEADCGLTNHEDHVETFGPQDRGKIATSGAVRYIEFVPQISYMNGPHGQIPVVSAKDIYVEQHARGANDYRYPLEPDHDFLGYVNQVNVCEAVIADRSVGMIINGGDSYYRDESIPGHVYRKKNEPINGNIFADTKFPTYSMTTPTAVSQSSTAERFLGGDWPDDPNILLNEWWIMDLDGNTYLQDSFMSERLNVMQLVVKAFPTFLLAEEWLKQYASSPLVVRYIYQATDTAKSISGSSYGVLRVHLPVEKVRIDETFVNSDEDLTKAPDRFKPQADCPDQYLGTYNNIEDHPVIVPVTVSTTSVSSVGAEWSIVGGGVSLGRFVELALSYKDVRTSQTGHGASWQQPLLVPANERVKLVLRCFKRINRWRVSEWSSDGYVQDAFAVEGEEPTWGVVWTKI